ALRSSAMANSLAIEPTPLLGSPPVGTGNGAFETFCLQLETAAKFFIRIARNSLKSFDSKK
ncbi:MAG: hypothetical protein WAN05_29470, partial [Roseiarcus sp.]